MKKILVSVLITILLFGLVGCEKTSSSMSYSYHVETGDRIKVKLETNDGYEISSNIPFEITLEDEILSSGMFIYGEQYGDYEAVAESDGTILSKGEKEGNRYVMWQFDGDGYTEYNYAVLVGDSNTGILLGNTTSKESAEDIFNRLSFSILD